jgi:general secretion pathway protein A
VTGEVGTGKTTLCRTLLERLDGDTELAFLFNPSRTALELLQTICAEFDLPAEGLARRALMAQLDRFLVEQKRLGRRVLLIIDEAQTLSENTLEQVRLLSNLETSREKLIQILLLGQPELDRKLDGRSLRQLRQRISVRWKLQALTPEETRAYVRHRVTIAAGQPKELFNEAALREVHRRTGGIPRLINQLCDRALLAGYAARKSQIRPALIRAAAREIPDARRRGDGELHRSSWMRPSFVAIASLALVVTAAYAGMQVGRHGLANAAQSLLTGIDLFAADSDERQLANRPPASPESGGSIDSRSPARNGAGPGLPAVGANHLRDDIDPARPDTARMADPRGDSPTLARLVGFVPSGPGNDPHFPSIPNSEAMPVQSQKPNAGRLISDKPLHLVASAVALPIPQPPRSEILALAPGLLAKLLENRDERVAMAESQRAVLERFGRRVPRLKPGPTNPKMLQAGIEERGLTATSFDGGSIELLRRLDHPVLLPFVLRDGLPNRKNSIVPRWLAITGFVGDRARLAGLISGRIVTVPILDLANHWLETGIIIWERYEPVPDLLAIGGKGRGVLWLQRSLSELHFFQGSANGSFDSDTRSALIEFQRRHGLVADGMAGPLTQIALYAKLDRYPVPRLSKAPNVEVQLPPARVMPSSAQRNQQQPPSVSARPPVQSRPRPSSSPSAASTPPSPESASAGDRK